LREGSGLEAYYFRDQGATTTSSREHLDIFGARGTARFGPVALEFEPVYETGRRFNGMVPESVTAWGGHADVSVDTPIAGFKNTFVLGYVYGSGSREAADGGSLRKEFSNANNDTSLIGDMGFIGDLSGAATNDGLHHASGMRVVTAGWGINLLKELTFTATGHYFEADHAPSGMSREMGVETDFILTWNINKETALVAAYDRFFTGAFFRDAVGAAGDIDYGYVMLQFNLFAGRKKI